MRCIFHEMFGHKKMRIIVNNRKYVIVILLFIRTLVAYFSFPQRELKNIKIKPMYDDVHNDFGI